MTRARVSVTLPRNRNAPRQARELLRAHADGLAAGQLDTAVLLISELVTNAVLHGSGEIRLEIDVAVPRARYAVCDDGGGTPIVRERPGADGGWGLRLVSQLARRWGVGEGRTRVWFEL